MSVLVVTAVDDEAAAVVRRLGPATPAAFGPYRNAGRVLDLAIDVFVVAAGVGEAAAAAATATALATNPGIERVLNAGIAGTLRPTVAVGELVLASRVVAADLGAEEPGSPGRRVPLSALGYDGGAIECDASWVEHGRIATGAHVGTILTVSTVTASDERLRDFCAAHPDALAEAMEGHGVATAADAFGLPFTELRAISNPVGVRDPKHWSIAEALDALGNGVHALLTTQP